MVPTEEAAVRLLVCGGRDFDDPSLMRTVLGAFWQYNATLVHGDAKGADTCARRVWQGFGRRAEAFPANWSEHGKGAGPIRNLQMLATLSEGDVCVAFPGGAGTAHMIDSCLRAGIPVLRVIVP